MRPTLRDTCIAAAAVFVMACCHAAAQPPGPVPGTDPAHYAVGYVQDQEGRAAVDPAGYAQSQATPAEVGNQTAEVGFIACWQVYEAAGANHLDAVCSRFFTAPGDVNAAAPATNATAGNVTQALGNVTGGAQQLANTTVDAVQQIVQDPGNATSQLDRIVKAVQDFMAGLTKIVLGAVGGALTAVGTTAIALVTGTVQVVLAILAGLGVGLGKGAQLGLDGIRVGLAALGDVGVAAANGIAAAGQQMAQSLAMAAGAVGAVAGRVVASAAAGLAAGLDVAGHAVQGALNAVGAAMSSAGRATVEGTGAAIKGVADAAAASAKALGDAVSSLFGGHAASAAPSPDGAVPIVPRNVPASGLLDGVTEKLPV